MKLLTSSFQPRIRMFALFSCQALLWDSANNREWYVIHFNCHSVDCHSRESVTSRNRFTTHSTYLFHRRPTPNSIDKRVDFNSSIFHIKNCYETIFVDCILSCYDYLPNIIFRKIRNQESTKANLPTKSSRLNIVNICKFSEAYL